MNPQRYGELETEAARRFEDEQLCLPEKLSAKRKIVESLTEMTERGEVLRMSDEEERMVRCFRKFRARGVKPGAVFKWQTHPDNEGIIAAREALGQRPARRKSIG